MPQATFGQTLQVGGISIQKSAVRSADSGSSVEPSLPAGKTVTNWVKTDANTAAADLPGGHGYTNGNFDVYWSESGVPKLRYGVAGTITVNAIALDGGTGDDFPASATTGVVVTKQVQVNASIDGDALQIIGFSAEYTTSSETSKVHLDLQDTGSASIEAITLNANDPRIDDIAGGITNVYAGNPITKILASNGSATNACTLKVGWLQDATP